MVSSISNADSDVVQLMMAQMYQKLNAGDTDGIKGLSKDELSSINSSNDVGSSAFLESLTEQFDSLDADRNGQLSANEIASVKPPSEPMGPPPGMSIPGNEDNSDDLLGSVTSTDSNTATSSAESLELMMEQLLKSLMESFSESFDKTDSTAEANAETKINSLVSSADTDGTTGLSLNELNSVGSTENTGKTGFINDLINNFKSYDSNGDGQLSVAEIKTAMLDEQFSKQELAAISADSSNLGSSLGNALGSLSGSFVQKLLSNYQNGNLSSLASSLNIAG